MEKSFCPEVLSVVVKSLRETGVGNLALKVTSLDAQTSFVFLGGNSIPTKNMKLLILSSTPPNEIPLDLVDGVMDFLGDLNILHDMRGNTVKSGLNKDNSTSHVEYFGFPARESSSYVVKDELEINISSLIVEDRKAKVLTKG